MQCENAMSTCTLHQCKDQDCLQRSFCHLKHDIPLVPANFRELFGPCQPPDLTGPDLARQESSGACGESSAHRAGPADKPNDFEVRNYGLRGDDHVGSSPLNQYDKTMPSRVVHRADTNIEAKQPTPETFPGKVIQSNVTTLEQVSSGTSQDGSPFQHEAIQLPHDTVQGECRDILNAGINEAHDDPIDVLHGHEERSNASVADRGIQEQVGHGSSGRSRAWLTDAQPRQADTTGQLFPPEHAEQDQECTLGSSVRFNNGPATRNLPGHAFASSSIPSRRNSFSTISEPVPTSPPCYVRAKVCAYCGVNGLPIPKFPAWQRRIQAIVSSLDGVDLADLKGLRTPAAPTAATSQEAELMDVNGAEASADTAGDPNLQKITLICADYPGLIQSMKKMEMELAVLREQNDETVKELEARLRQTQADKAILEARLNNRGVLVYARIRPNPAEQSEGGHLQYDLDKARLTVRTRTSRASSNKTFDVNHIFPSTTKNDEVCQHLLPKIQAFLHGCWVTVVMDGQSGTGKSHTMFRGKDAIATFAAEEIFRWLDNADNKGLVCDVEVSCFEFYLGETRNLLAQDSGSGNKPSHEKPGYRCESLQDIKRLLNRANTNRSLGATFRNRVSSRGHSLTTITVTKSGSSGFKEESRLALVDLAGAENAADHDSNPDGTMQALAKGAKTKKAKAKEALAKEAKAINNDRCIFVQCVLSMLQSRNCNSMARESQLTLKLRDWFTHQTSFVFISHVSALEHDLNGTTTTLKQAAEIFEKYQSSRRHL
ncbi:MAG: hypothetical protein L6R39_004340 [Caloplaca ligustica]|nr:MAG: hypothetical protein L6R39_004340 [Caloplaca ligustica]